jgi:hypothetical protein
MDGKDAPVFLNNGFYTLITNKTGPFTVELEFAVSQFEKDGESGFSMQLSPSGATEVSFTVEAAETLEFKTPATGEVITKNGNAQTISFAIASQGSLSLSWRRELPEEKVQAGRIYAETHVLAGIGEGLVQCNATINYTVLHQGIDTFKVSLPKDVTVLDVRGSGIRDWTFAADGTLEVLLNYAAEGAYRLSIDYERALTGDIPLPKVAGVAREKTFVGVDARSAVELVSGTPAGATAIDVRELPPAILGLTDFPVLLAYKARGGEVRIPLEVKTHPDVDMLVTLVDAAIASVLVTPDGRRMVHMQYAVRNNRNQFLRLKMPEGAEVWSASVAGKPVKVARSDSGLLIPLVRSDSSSGALSGFVVDLVYVEAGTELQRGKNRMRVDLPEVDAPTSMVQLSVYVPYDVHYLKRSDEGTLRQVDWFSASPELPQLAPDVAARASSDMRATGNAQAGTLAQGVDPVEVNIPLSGNIRSFEKTLALNEDLWVEFGYKYKPKK